MDEPQEEEEEELQEVEGKEEEVDGKEEVEEGRRYLLSLAEPELTERSRGNSWWNLIAKTNNENDRVDNFNVLESNNDELLNDNHTE